MFDSEIREELRRIQAELRKPFPASAHQIRELPGKGYWAFLSHQIIRQRLDEVVPEWQSDFSPLEQIGNDIVCRCGITFLGIRKEAIGSVPLIAATSKDGKDVSRGSAADRVAAEALKNAAEMWGAGAYLDDQAFVANYLSKHSPELSDEIKNKLRSLISYLRNKGDLPPVNSSVSLPSTPKTQSPTIKSNQIVEPQPKTENSAKLLEKTFDRNLLNAEIESIMKRKNIGVEQAKNSLFELFNVRSRQQLTDAQLAKFLEYLRGAA